MCGAEPAAQAGDLFSSVDVEDVGARELPDEDHAAGRLGEPAQSFRLQRRFGSIDEVLSIYAYCAERGIAIYGGGQGEVECGRGQIQYLASLFHPDTPNDVAPSGYNDPSVPDGLPDSPLEPAPSPTGFRWAE